MELLVGRLAPNGKRGSFISLPTHSRSPDVLSSSPDALLLSRLNPRSALPLFLENIILLPRYSSSRACQPQTFGLLWPDLNDRLFYNDVVRASNSELTLIEFYSSKYNNSAPLQG
ncbi:hypothetical protein ACFX14_012308 [Malus domestica]